MVFATTFYGDPAEYDILKRHPGSFGYANLLAYYTVSAASVLHYFNIDRPGNGAAFLKSCPRYRCLPSFGGTRWRSSPPQNGGG